jgi:hypothetical protein
MLAASQPAGKSWIDRSSSVMKIATFLPCASEGGALVKERGKKKKKKTKKTEVCRSSP